MKWKNRQSRGESIREGEAASSAMTRGDAEHKARRAVS